MFLQGTRHDALRAEEYYERAVKSEPTDADHFGNYGAFLHIVRKDLGRAETYYRRSIEIDPTNANVVGNLAGLLLSEGRSEEGAQLIAQARGLGPQPVLALELAFYDFAHGDSQDQRASGLGQLKRLLGEGVRSPDWSLDANVAQAKRAGHPEPELVATVARVIANAADLSELEKSESWRNA